MAAAPSVDGGEAGAGDPEQGGDGEHDGGGGEEGGDVTGGDDPAEAALAAHGLDAGPSGDRPLAPVRGLDHRAHVLARFPSLGPVPGTGATGR